MAETLVWPLRIGRDGRLVTVEQDDPADIASCVACIAATPKGWDFAHPEFGMRRDGLFRQDGIDPQQVAADILEHEPRATPTIVAELIEDLHQRVLVDPTGSIA